MSKNNRRNRTRQQHGHRQQQQPKNSSRAPNPSAVSFIISICNAHNPSHEHQHAKSTDAQKHGERVTFWTRCRVLLELAFTAIVAVATAMYAVVTYRQLDAMREQTIAILKQVDIAKKAAAESTASTNTSIELTRKASEAAGRSANAAEETAASAVESNKILRNTSEKSLRAYVTPITNSTLQYSPASKTFSATVQVQNTGQTPAHEVQSTGRVIQKPIDYKGPFDLPKEIPTYEMTAGPSRIWEITLSSEPTGQRDTTKATVWVYGVINYKDVFGEPRFTNFRFRQGLPLANGKDAYQLLFEREGNDSN